MKKGVRIGLIIIAVLSAIAGCTYAAANWAMDSMLNQIEHGEKIASEDAAIAPEVSEAVKEQNIVNIALFGADNSQGPTGTDEDRSDAMKIISLDFDNKKIKITSVERDVVVWIPGDHQKYGHFNWAYWFGGPTLAVQTLNYNLDLDITQYVTFSFSAVEKLVDLIGGVDIELTAKEVGALRGNTKNSVHTGSNTLNGYDAMLYCRQRYIDSDFVRMDRQNNVINAIIAKLKHKNILELMEIVNTMLPSVTTNCTNTEIKDYLISLLSFDLSHIETYKEPSGEYDDIMRCPGLGGYLVRSYSDMVRHLHANIYGNDEYEPSQTVIDNEKKTYKTYGEFKK
ncbi:LCP family protein [Holdemania massiliensis]|uniref:LCP family protein n=1 Tax=Holdemania massiliensis TaxID=1468449 RepID=UPI001F051A80|nr:LCP family protein [Holdemania massiliensis]MCH1942736.1 LCP family protein [Holdemania massiliensis]